MKAASKVEMLAGAMAVVLVGMLVVYWVDLLETQLAALLVGMLVVY